MGKKRYEAGAAIHAMDAGVLAKGQGKAEIGAGAAKDARYALSIGDVAAALVLAAGTLTGYTLTLYSSVAGGDSGELVAESCHLGISHPPGYPLFNLLVHLVATQLPIGANPAWRANFFSAACGTMAVVLIYLSILQWTASSNWNGRRAAAFTAAALFGFSPLTWTYAVGAEVFALNNAFAALLLYILLRYKRHQEFKWAVRGAFVCGLAMCNQHTIVLFELPIVVWVLWTRRRSLWWHELAVFTAAFVLGLLPYAYMPLTAHWNPQAGSWGDVTTLRGFLHHLRRADYGTFRLYASHEANEDLWERLYLYGRDLSSREVPLQLAFPVSALGVWQSLRASSSLNRQLGVFVVAMYTFYMIVFHSLANLPISEGLIYGVQMRFWQQPNVLVFAWLGLGLNYIVDMGGRFVSGHALLNKMMATGCQLGCLALVVVQIWRWHELCDQSHAWYIRNYAQALLDPLPRNAVLFVNFDLQWTSLRYLQRCEHRRPDVTVLNLSMMTYSWFAAKHGHYPHLHFPGSRLVPFGSSSDGFSMASLLDANINSSTKKRGSKKQRRFFLGGKLSYSDRDFDAKYTLVPYGLLDEFQPQVAQPPSLQDWYASQQPVMRMVHERLPILPPADMYNDETWEWTIARDHGMKSLSWSTYLLDKTIAEDPQNLSLLVEATHAMEKSYQFEPLQFWNEASNLKNLGLAYAQIVKSSQSFPTNMADPFFNEVVGHTVQDPTRLKDRASSRMLEVWYAWLQVPEARQDPGYEAIQNVVQKFVPAAKSSQRAENGGKARKPRARTGKRKTKKRATAKNPTKHRSI